MDLLEERKQLQKKLVKVKVGMEQLQKTKEKIEQELVSLKLRFKTKTLKESGVHDTHYFLRLSIETPIGNFSVEQWDSCTANWPKNLLEFISLNIEAFDEEDIKYYLTKENLEYVREFKKFSEMKKKFEDK